MISFRLTKSLDQPTLLTIIIEYWENTRIISSTWVNEGCRKVTYYQTTRVMHWNFSITGTANAIIWHDISWDRVKETVMEGNCWLNINIEGHVVDPYFDTLKTCSFFYLFLFFHLLVFSRKGRFTDSRVFLA